jgi:hypothetical protein
MGRWRPTQAELVTPPAVADPELWSERQRRRESETNRDRQARQQRRTRPASELTVSGPDPAVPVSQDPAKARVFWEGQGERPQSLCTRRLLGGAGSLVRTRLWRAGSLISREDTGKSSELGQTGGARSRASSPLWTGAERISLDPGTGKLGSGIRATPRPSRDGHGDRRTLGEAELGLEVSPRKAIALLARTPTGPNNRRSGQLADRPTRLSP